MGQSLFETLRKSEKLPSPPGTALRVLQLCSSEEMSAPGIARVIGSDPALSSRILMYANSPISGIGRSVSSIDRAVALLGLRTVRMLSLGFSLMAQHIERRCDRFDYDGFWRHCLGCAAFSRRLAGLQPAASGEDAFTAGLLANLGQLVLAVGMPEEYGAILVRAGDDPEAQTALEEVELGTTHMDLGARLLEEWRLPPAICRTVRCFRMAITDPGQADPILIAVHVAEQLVRRLWGVRRPSGEQLDHAAALAKRFFNLAGNQFEVFVDEAAAELNELTSILALPVGEASKFAELRATAQDQMLRISLATQIENQTVRHENRSLRHRVRVDALTGIGNRQALDERLRTEIERSSRRSSPLALILADIDHFKKLNDAYGHQAGDQVLRGVADSLCDCLRKVDFPARYGGEEFAVVAPDTPVRGADVVAERIRQTIARGQFPYEGQYLQVTVSLGVAVWAAQKGTVAPEQLIKAADACLYQAKRDGRNQVRITEIDGSTAMSKLRFLGVTPARI